MKRCNRCILPESFPGLSLDEQGICSHCARHGVQTQGEVKKAEYEKKFVRLLEEKKGVGTYDALMAYSGGKDSTYTLDILVHRYGLRVLALTVDNCFMSKQASFNILKVGVVLL